MWTPHGFFYLCLDGFSLFESINIVSKMENHIKEDAMFKFKKMLYQQLPNEEGEYLDEADWNEVAQGEDFHENFRERLKEEYVESYKELQTMLLREGMQDINGGISEDQFDDLKKEAQDKLINASTLATFYRMYKVFYSVTMN